VGDRRCSVCLGQSRSVLTVKHPWREAAQLRFETDETLASLGLSQLKPGMLAAPEGGLIDRYAVNVTESSLTLDQGQAPLDSPTKPHG
jgi:hypothetical protein